jgi:tRNA pseudouridine38-40 synthase
VILKLVLAYDGTEFHGWARQPRVRTVEGVVVEALARVLPATPAISVAGRTDAGVHARGQVVSFEAPDDADPPTLHRALNAMLGPEVVVRSAARAPATFDARFSAAWREYRYRLDLGEVPDPFTARFAWYHPAGLSLGPMRRAAKLLVGDHDFASFGRKPEDAAASTVRRLERLSVARDGDRLEITARANAFLQQMVRSLVGTLVAVGEGKIEAGSMPDVLAARDRSRAGPVAPAHGLTLERVAYPRRSGPLTVPRSRR